MVCLASMNSSVAPHAGAWIETCLCDGTTTNGLVAPHAGAWIDTMTVRELVVKLVRRTPRGCVD